MLEDSHSYIRQHPAFTPLKEFLSDAGEFRMADLLRQARQV